MRWLMIVLFVSVAALLVASAGVARHIWREHRQRSLPQTEEEALPQAEEAVRTQTEEGQ